MMPRFRASLLLLLLTAPSASAQQTGSISRSQVMTSAAAFTYHRWTATTANLHASCSSSYASDYSVGAHTGVPYTWGGFDDLPSFDEKLKKGYAAGCHSRYGVLSCATGLDCSGFVSRVWGLPTKYSTTTIQQVSTPLSQHSDLRAGDAWVNPGSHIVLHAYFREDGTPVWYEASGGASKVRFMTSGSWSYLNRYSPIRYTGIQEDAPDHAGTVSDPIPVTTFPFQDSRNTVLAESSTFDSYACKPQTGERGPEYIYAVDLPSAGQLTAAVQYVPGVDVDVQLLSAPQSDACLSRGDLRLSYTVPQAGRYFVVVDSYSSGLTEYSGPYSLSISFSSAAASASNAP